MGHDMPVGLLYVPDNDHRGGTQYATLRWGWRRYSVYHSTCNSEWDREGSHDTLEGWGCWLCRLVLSRTTSKRKWLNKSSRFIWTLQLNVSENNWEGKLIKWPRDGPMGGKHNGKTALPRKGWGWAMDNVEIFTREVRQRRYLICPLW